MSATSDSLVLPSSLNYIQLQKGRVRPWMQTHKNTLLVLDRCGRVIQQTQLGAEELDLVALEGVLLDADTAEWCGPCLVTEDERSNVITPELLDMQGSPAEIVRNKSSQRSSEMIAREEHTGKQDYVFIHTLRSGLHPMSHATVAEEMPEEAADNMPEAGADDAPEAAADNIPEAVADNAPEATADDTPEAGADDTPGTAADDLQPQEADVRVVEDSKKNEEEINVGPTKKWERKKNKKKRKKAKKDKKKRKRVGEGKMTTVQPREEDKHGCKCRLREERVDTKPLSSERDVEGGPRCPCVYTHEGGEPVSLETITEDEHINRTMPRDEEIIRLIEQLTEYLNKQKALETTQMIETTTVTSSFSPIERHHAFQSQRNRDKPRNSKQQRQDRQQDIDEGIEMVTEDEEFIEYPDKIDAFVQTEDEISARFEDLDQNLDGVRVGQERREELDVTFTVSDDEQGLQSLVRDVLSSRGATDALRDMLATDILAERSREAPTAGIYVTAPGDITRREPIDEGQIWGTYKEVEPSTEYNTKTQMNPKDTPKKGKKIIDMEDKKGGKFGKKYKSEASEEQGLVREWEEGTAKQSGEHGDGRSGRNRLATWREVTLSPQSDASDGQHTRIVLYASNYDSPSDEEQPSVDKVTLLHTKLHPNKHSKH